ncbi:MAG: glycerate kinase [Desulfobacterales bacterium]|nr:glycerate kinase [Desulfobacterales bacterium]
MSPGNTSFSRLRQDAASIFKAGVEAVNAEAAVLNACRINGDDLQIHDRCVDLSAVEHVYVIGAGKASADMAVGLASLIEGRITAGAITVKYHHTRALEHIRLIEAAHPVPDANGVQGARQILDILDRAAENDLVICLLSGGGSALLPLPAEGLTLADKQETLRVLLACGAEIDEINAIRKHMSAIKGGRLARRASPATLITLVVSDVIGDRLDVIASGPSVPDTSTFSDCMRIIDAYRLKKQIPKAVLDHMTAGVAGRVEETPKADTGIFEGTFSFVIGSSIAALEKAQKTAEALGYGSLILSSMIQGESKDAAKFHTAIAKEIRKSGNPIPPPACLISGGETTVTISGVGTGGRNQEFALAAAIDIKDEEAMVLLCGGTDGTDGPTDAAGAVVDSNTVRNAEKAGVCPYTHLKNNDSYNFFKQTGELLMTGPTGTNVMDLRVILIGKSE